MNEAEKIGRSIFREACLDPFAGPVAGAAFELARRLYGRGSVVQARILDDGRVARCGDRTVIAHRMGVSRPRANFAVAQMLARLALERAGVEDAAKEKLVAAWI